MYKSLLEAAFQTMVDQVDEGIHIVDQNGFTRVYNKAMENIEGMSAEDVVGKHILEAYEGWQEENSTLLTVLKTKEPLHRNNQKYLNLKGKPISTSNTSLPLFDQGEIVGAIELSRNFTEVSVLSEQLMDLRQQLMKPNEHVTPKKHYTFDMLIGRNPAYVNAIKLAKRAALTQSSVLVIGDTGTGKELFSQSIHYESTRKDKPFLAINCAAMPESLLESILFGTSKGSFTGAVERPGLFEQADGGTLFLDEINSMSLNLQSKLLRVLQESYCRRVGGLKDIPVDVRIIAATNEPPTKMIETGEFRKDLYYRINVIAITIPSLKDRPEDVKLLMDHFISYFNQKLGKDVWMLSEELIEVTKRYDWKGNVRELQNFVESAMNMVHDEHVITREHLVDHWLETLFTKKETGPLRIAIDQNLYLNQQLEQLENEIIHLQMVQNDYNITQTAKSLGLSRQNLQYKLKKMKLNEYTD